MLLFPSRPLTSLIKGYFAYMHILFQEEENDGDDHQGDTNDDPFDTIIVCFQTTIPWIIFDSTSRMRSPTYPTLLSRTES
jgi:hypothetical protein